ncbi:hypothetical protein T492DRAFT_943353 [Pavlovales sp. CCMP2436]|nr:hypothetical protein T492DRAFT_943353 [Pavlovales sp. CCMP2436]|mmetsp:Transcript_14839/g.37530  ORF Transcript_14839/g.37530 Transcript_14839/m.37530 type:complete len:173 (-) Transcript_14839:196-714(-)
MVFHVVIPGRAAVGVEGFAQTSPTRWVLPVEALAAINEVVVFLSAPLAPELGLAVYIAAPPFEEAQWHYLGALHNECPSAVFKPQYVWNARDATPTAVQLGVELLPLATLGARAPEMASSEVIEVAKLIATDLITYMQSFAGRLPSDGMEKWLRRFTEKCQRQGINWLHRRD